MPKIFSIVKNGRRIDITHEEFKKMVEQAGIELEKGGPGSGRYPAGSGGKGEDLHTPEGKTSYNIVKEKLSNGNTIHYKKTDKGTHYNADYPDDLIRVLESHRENGTRLHFESGDTKTGKSWGDRESGRIGRSTGPIQIPLVIHNERSSGGGALSSIVRVTNARGGETVWEHPNYKPPKDGFNIINRSLNSNDIEKGGQGSGRYPAGSGGHASNEKELKEELNQLHLDLNEARRSGDKGAAADIQERIDGLTPVKTRELVSSFKDKEGVVNLITKPSKEKVERINEIKDNMKRMKTAYGQEVDKDWMNAAKKEIKTLEGKK